MRKGQIKLLEKAEKEGFTEEQLAVLRGNQRLNYAFLVLDREKDDLSASCYQDILLYPELSKEDQFIPFVALMQTTHPFDDSDMSVTLFSLIGEGRVWEHMANKPFLLACRRKVELDEDVTVENWKDRIDIDELEATYRVADLYTGPIEA